MENTFVNKRLRDLYDDYYESPMEWRLIGAVDKVKNIIKLCNKYPHQKILEIGSGEGAILKRLSDVNFGDALYSVEISKSAVDVIAKRNIKKLVKGRLFDGYNLPYGNNEFDLAILSHVLEHVEYPRKILYEASRVAKYVFIEVPLEDHLRLGKNFVFDRVGHINYYRSKTIRRLLQTCDLEVLSCLLANSSYTSYKYRFGKKAFLRYLPKELFLRVMPAIATKFFTYHYALLCKNKESFKN